MVQNKVNSKFEIEIYNKNYILLTPPNSLLIFTNQIHDNVLPDNTLSYFSCRCVSGVAIFLPRTFDGYM